MRLRHTDIHIDIYEYIRTYRQKQYGVTAISYIHNLSLDYDNILSQIISTYILDQMLRYKKKHFFFQMKFLSNKEIYPIILFDC